MEIPSCWRPASISGAAAWIRRVAIAMTALLMVACGGDEDRSSGGNATAFTVEARVPGFSSATTRPGEADAVLTVEAWNLDLARLEVATSTDTTWTVEPAGAAVKASTDTPTLRVFDLSSLPQGSVTVVLRHASSTAEARVTVTVAADRMRYAPNPRRLGEVFTYQYVDMVDGVESSHFRTLTVETVDHPSWNYRTKEPYTSTPSGIDTFMWFTAGGNLYSEELHSIVGIAYRRDWHQYDFPLYEGKQWRSEFLWYVDDEPFSAAVYESSRVAGIEMVTVPAGKHKAVRVVTHGAEYGGKSAVVPIREGDQPFRTYERTCWWSIDLSIQVRCDTTTWQFARADGSLVSTTQSRVELSSYSAP